MRKLPYIADKNLYAAVMGACSYIRETGYFNKAISYYSKKYGVDAADIEKYMRIAQSNGRKLSSEKRKYQWYAVEWAWEGERATGINYFDKSRANYYVCKATSKNNAMKRKSQYDDFSEHGLQAWFGRVIPFKTKEEAEEQVRKWEVER